VAALDFPPDGTTLVSSRNDAAVLWDVACRQPIDPALRGHTAFVTDVEFAADGKEEWSQYLGMEAPWTRSSPERVDDALSKRAVRGGARRRKRRVANPLARRGQGLGRSGRRALRLGLSKLQAPRV
jgi:hypothetical protein